MQSYTQTPPNRLMECFLKLTHWLLVIAIGGGTLILSVPAHAADGTDANTGTILGTVVDTSDDPIPSATVVLQGRDADRLTVVKIGRAHV